MGEYYGIYDRSGYKVVKIFRTFERAKEFCIKNSLNPRQYEISRYTYNQLDEEEIRRKVIIENRNENIDEILNNDQ